MQANPNGLIALLTGWSPGLLIFSVKAALLLAASLLLSLLVRPRHAALRHRILGSCMAGIIAIALLSPLLPAIPIPFAEAERVTQFLDGPIRYEFLGERTDIISDSAPARFPALPMRSTAADGSPLTLSLPPGTLLWALWFSGFAVAGIRFLLRRATVNSIVRASRTVDARTAAQAKEIARKLGVSAPVRLRLHDAFPVPFAAGILRPVIVLPTNWLDASPEIREAILLHEFMHIRRADLLNQLLAAAVCALQWWNPLAWLAARRMAHEREMACDAAVLAAGVRPSLYASTLLHLSSEAVPRRLASVAPLSPKRNFKERIMNVLHTGNLTRPAGRLTRFSVLVFIPALMVVTGLIQPTGLTESAVTPLPAAFSDELVLTKTSARQGEAIFVKINGERQPTFARGRFLARTVRFAAVDGVLCGLLPVAADDSPGEQDLRVACTYADGSSRTLTAAVTVLARESKAVKWPFNKTRMPTEIGDALATSADKPLWSGAFRLPISGRQSAAFGLIKIQGDSRVMHDGVDISAPRGTPVLSTNAGVVMLARELKASGKTVVIDHGMGLHSAYLHLDSFAVAEGARVAAGSEIGACGSTGLSTAPHLHWMMVFDGVPCDPMTFIEQF